MGIQVKVQFDGTVTFTYDGDTYSAKVRADGGLELTSRFRNEGILSGYSVADLVQKMTNADIAAQEKRELEKRIAQARSTPQDAYLLTLDQRLGDSIEPISVRGLDRRSGDALITRGTKESVGRDRVLRPLTEADLADIRALLRRRERARKDLTEAEGVDLYDVPSLYDISLVVTYDVASDACRVEYDGQVFATGQGREGRNELEDQIKRYLIRRDFTHRVYTRERTIVAIADVADGDNLPSRYFKSAEAATTYLAAKTEWEDVSRVLKEMSEEYRFDFSVYGDQK